MFPDDVVGFVIQGVHIFEVDSPVVESVAVFVVADETFEGICDLTVHLDPVYLAAANFPAYCVPEMCRFLGLPLVPV